MLARVARRGWETPAPDARGFLGKARPPRVSRVLRGRREAAPEGRQVDIPAPRPRGRAATAGAPPGGVLDAPVRGGRAPAPGKRASEPGGRPAPEKPRAANAGAPVPQTDAGGRAENAEAGGATAVKELGKTAP